MHEFLRNVWYMAAWAEEVGEGLLSRRIAGRKLVLFRAADGTPVALEDRCPHRFAPLSLGQAPISGPSGLCPSAWTRAACGQGA